MSIFDRRISRQDFLRLGLNSALTLALSNTINLGNVSLEQGSNPPETSDIKPLVGAIRWGGWFKGSKWANNLQDPKWHNRLPFYTSVSPDGKSIEIVGDRQEVMDQEILFAKKAGIDFWAYCLYDKRSPDFNIYNYGFNRHLASKIATGPKIALILQGSHFGGVGGWEGFTDNLVQAFTHDKYQILPERRPLLFVLDTPKFNEAFGYYDKSMKALDKLREKTIKANLNLPFLVGLNVEGPLIHLGFDALSAYTANGVGEFKEYPYTFLEQANLEFWKRVGGLGFKFVPTINVGWDPRPRLELPDIGEDYHGPWYKMPTKDELLHHISLGVKWLRDNPSQSAHNMLLFYAWNEFDEGGILVPTLAEGTLRIDVLAELFKNQVV